MANREWNIPKEKPKGRSAVLIAVALVLSLGIGFASGYFLSALSNGMKVETSKNDEFSSTVKDQPASTSEKKQSSKVKPSANSQVKADISRSSNSSEKTVESESEPEPEPEYETATDEPAESDIPVVTENVPQTDEYVEPTTYEEDVSYVEPVEAEPDTVEATSTGYSPEEFQLAGEIYDDEWRYTWYSQNVLPGEGLDIPGRHVEDGYVVDGEGNVVLASCDLEQGSVVDIPVGTGVGKVYDYCPISGTLDVYVDF